jgi:site-specific DNA-cytosine methylase
LRRLGVKPLVYFSSEIDPVAIEALDRYVEAENSSTANSFSSVIQVDDVRDFSFKKDALPIIQKKLKEKTPVLEQGSSIEPNATSTNSKSSGSKGKQKGQAEPQVDLLIGGSPCTDLSFLGQGAGVVNGSQSSFFFEYVRVLKETKPRWFLFENVRMRKEDEAVITRELGVEPVEVGKLSATPLIFHVISI